MRVITFEEVRNILNNLPKFNFKKELKSSIKFESKYRSIQKGFFYEGFEVNDFVVMFDIEITIIETSYCTQRDLNINYMTLEYDNKDVLFENKEDKKVFEVAFRNAILNSIK